MIVLTLRIFRQSGNTVLEIRKSPVSFDEKDGMALEKIVTDGDEKEALRFLKKTVYERILHSRQGRLKSHLDTACPVEGFRKRQSL
jgi:hypothetical protein